MRRKLLIILAFLPLFVAGQNYRNVLGKYNSGIWSYQGGAVYYQQPIYNLSAIEWFNRMSSDPSTTLKIAGSQLFDSIQYYNIDDSLNTLVITAVEDTGQIRNLLSDSYTPSLVSTASDQDWWFYPNQGISCNINGQGYINTNANFSDLSKYTQNSASLGLYCMDDYIESAYSYGAYNTTPSVNYSAFRHRRAGNTFYGGVNVPAIESITNSNASGLFVMQRTHADTIEYYREGAYLGFDLSTSVAPIDRDAYLMKTNINGSAGTGVNYRFSAYLIGAKLSTLQNQKLSEALDRYFNAIQTGGTEWLHQTDNLTYKVNRRLPLNELFNVIAQEGAIKIAGEADSLHISTDNGATYSKRLYFPQADSVALCYIWDNMNITIANYRNELYITDTNFASITEIFAQNIDSTSMTIHTPVNNDYPGSYFRNFNVPRKIYYYGKELLIFGNYPNTDEGAAPTNIYYSFDYGASLHTLKNFGQNTSYTDDGTSDGGTGGTLLGDATDTDTVRHVHSIDYQPLDSSFWVQTGDSFDETNIYKMKWDTTTGKISSWSEEFNAGVDGGRYKLTGIRFVGDSCILISDNNLDSDGKGIFRCHYDDIGTKGNHINVTFDTYLLEGNYYDDDIIIASTSNTDETETVFSQDDGVTWTRQTFSYLGINNFGILYSGVDENGWYRFTGRTYPYNSTTVLFQIK